MTTHTLKLSEPYFSLVAQGIKNFEVRQYTAQGPDKPARDFKVGDTLRFIPTESDDGDGGVFTVLDRTITYILKDTDPHMADKLPAGYCILGLLGQPMIECTTTTERTITTVERAITDASDYIKRHTLND